MSGLILVQTVCKGYQQSPLAGKELIVTFTLFQFSGQSVQDSYVSFVENYKTSGKVIENALQTKSSVQKFVEVSPGKMMENCCEKIGQIGIKCY